MPGLLRMQPAVGLLPYRGGASKQPDVCVWGGGRPASMKQNLLAGQSRHCWHGQGGEGGVEVLCEVHSASHIPSRACMFTTQSRKENDDTNGTFFFSFHFKIVFRIIATAWSRYTEPSCGWHPARVCVPPSGW